MRAFTGGGPCRLRAQLGGALAALWMKRVWQLASGLGLGCRRLEEVALFRVVSSGFAVGPDGVDDALRGVRLQPYAFAYWASGRRYGGWSGLVGVALQHAGPLLRAVWGPSQGLTRALRVLSGESSGVVRRCSVAQCGAAAAPG